MRPSDILLGLLLLSPYLFTVYYILSKFTQIDYFTMFSFISLVTLVLSRYSSAILLSLMLVPSLICFGLFVMGIPYPLIGLAAGYIMSFPLYIILGAFHEKKIENIIISYLLSLTLNISILYASGQTTSLTSPDIIINLMVRIPRTIVGGGQLYIPPLVNDVFTILTATSGIALLFIVIRRQEPEFPRSSRELLPLILSAIIILLIAVISRVWMYSYIVIASSMLLLLICVSAILKIVT